MFGFGGFFPSPLKKAGGKVEAKGQRKAFPFPLLLTPLTFDFPFPLLF